MCFRKRHSEGRKYLCGIIRPVKKNRVEVIITEKNMHFSGEIRLCGLGKKTETCNRKM